MNRHRVVSIARISAIASSGMSSASVMVRGQLLVQSDFVTIERARTLILEADELVAIFVACRKTAQARKAERETLRKRADAAARARSRRK